MTDQSSLQTKVTDKNQPTVDEIKSAHVFKDNTPEDDKKHATVQPARVFSEEDRVEIFEVQDDIHIGLTNALDLPPQKSTKKWVLLLFIIVLIAGVAELGLFINAIIENMDWLGGLWLTVLALFVLLVAQVLLKEYRGLKQLRQQSDIRQQSQSLADGAVIGLAEKHCLEMAKRLPDSYQVLVSQWRDSYASHHSDKEVLALFEHKVLSPIDKLAKKQVINNASAASVMIAVSPFALLDMLIVLWRNIQMMDQVSQIYGLRLGYFSRVRLIRKIFHTMVYAGAGEILSDAGNYALGAGVTGKLSTRVAQGLGAGVLTARIGLKAINESRPLPWLVEKKPSLSDVSKQLLSDLSQKIR